VVTWATLSHRFAVLALLVTGTLASAQDRPVEQTTPPTFRGFRQPQDHAQPQ
jgi:hypothetical protein